MKDIRNYLLIAFLIIIYIFAEQYSKAIKDIESKDNSIEWLESKNEKLSDGSIRAKVLEAKLSDIQKVVGQKDKELLRISKLKGVKSGVTIKTETEFDTIMVTTLITDPATKTQSFKEQYSDDYLTWKLAVNDDSISLSVGFKDTLSVAFREVDKKGWFTGKETVVDVKSLNKYSVIQDVKSFAVPQKKKSLLLKVAPYIVLGASVYLFTR